MRIELQQIELQFKQANEQIKFTDFSYFYGRMGAGKTSIAKLIDYCLGGDLDFSPALQLEFVSAKLFLVINDTLLTLERVRESNQIVASWNKNDSFEVVVPARKANGEVIPNSGIENLSDLIFYVSGIRPPKVRRSKTQEDSDLERLSIRDLLWYCYLDQDSMDSSFFNLDAEAAFYKRNKSKDVLRYIVGFHQERVAELETELQLTRENRLSLQSGAESLKRALEGEGIGTQLEISGLIQELENELVQVNQEIIRLRKKARENIPHYVDEIRQNARVLVNELLSISDAISSVEETIRDDERHIHELQMLRAKFRRASSARSILAGVEFVACPRCSQQLPVRETDECPVCGQGEPIETEDNINLDVIDADTQSRIQELKDSIERHSDQLSNLRHRNQYLVNEKQRLDQTVNEAMREYDSAYLSNALGKERRRAEIEQSVSKLGDYLRLRSKVDELLNNASNLEGKEIELRRLLKEARAEAEKDNSNLSELASLFLECLVRSRYPGIRNDDIVQIKAPNYLPELFSPEIGDLAVTSFSNISSGGKKSLFKTCFAVAIHRLAMKIDAELPNLLIIDSPMKNISERENDQEFRGFHQMLYELAASELAGTQFILIDKEYLPPPSDLEINFEARHMTPDNLDYPPLIRYYKGH